MSTTWNPDLYLKFQRERTQPSIDLVSRIDVADPARIVDIGCGPGNSTRVLWERWPRAEVIGLDSSPQMIASARREYAERRWIESDALAFESTDPFQVVYSNAAIQWIPVHPRLLDRLFALVAQGGALAVQLPLYDHMPVRDAISSVAASARWNDRLAGAGSAMVFHPPEFYYDHLRPLARDMTMWRTSYMHEMESHEQIVEMISSTGMRPYLERLNGEEREAFRADVVNAVRAAYTERPNGRVIFPFRRFFFVAYR